jgi:DNA-binding Lrp family transcriptional regulator
MMRAKEAADVRSAAPLEPANRRIDDVDRALLRELLAEGRCSYAELAERCHVSRSTAHARVERLQTIGAITGFTATVDPAVLGYGVSALVFLRIRQHDWRRARDAIAAVRGVESLLMCAGQYDLVAVVRCRDMAEFRDVLLVELHAIDDVTGSETAFVLDEVRRPLEP